MGSTYFVICLYILGLTWLPSYGKQTEQCDGGTEWNECGSPCTMTCRRVDGGCAAVCKARCQCPKSAPFWWEKQCIAHARCPDLDKPVPAKCQLDIPVETCEEWTRSWFHNATSKQCVFLPKRGCRDPENRFVSREACRQECHGLGPLECFNCTGTKDDDPQECFDPKVGTTPVVTCGKGHECYFEEMSRSSVVRSCSVHDSCPSCADDCQTICCGSGDRCNSRTVVPCPEGETCGGQWLMDKGPTPPGGSTSLYHTANSVVATIVAIVTVLSNIL